MTARQIRRAQERREAKLARKAARQATPASAGFETGLPETLEPETPEPPSCALTASQLAANRANAQLSTGPRTDEGKSKSSLNAVKTALTGRTVLLPSDDAAAYQRHIQLYEKELQPVGRLESELVQSLADTAWRLLRIPALEMGIFAKGRLEFADMFSEKPVDQRPILIEIHTFVIYERQLRNLQIQEARLRRQREKDTAALRTMQHERDRREARDLSEAATLYLAAQHDHRRFHPADHGFEFSIEDVEGYLEGVRAARIAQPILNPGRVSAPQRHSAAA